MDLFAVKLGLDVVMVDVDVMFSGETVMECLASPLADLLGRTVRDGAMVGSCVGLPFRFVAAVVSFQSCRGFSH